MLPPAFNRPPLADGVVRFVGDIVAAVVAETRAQAVDAAEMVIVDYDPLPVVVDPEAALEDGAPVLFPEHGSNVAIEFNFGEDADDPRRRRRRRSRVGSRTSASPPCRWSPTASSSSPTATAHSRCNVPTQAPFGVRDGLAGLLGIEPDERARDRARRRRRVRRQDRRRIREHLIVAAAPR